jgi:hypothetical protein
LISRGAFLKHSISGADPCSRHAFLNSQGGLTANLFDHRLVHDEVADSEPEGNTVVLNEIGPVPSAKDFYQTVSDDLPIMVKLRSSGPDQD